jgi:alkanesulfonate monooxygenase SsuD/methylene tetrahydromethanopterin reductase-like flavin-dependent oxidoreductase (luciferase family)
MLMILTENHTLVDPDDLDGLVRLAVMAEKAGFDAVMLSEHLALGPSANEFGEPTNPRAYAAPGNQDPNMAWPSTPVLAGAIAQATERVRIVLGAIIAPLRHPVLLAKELATLDRLSQGRLVVQPTVSWHADEYAALGVPFEHRGVILDECLDAMHRLWDPSPASFDGEWFSFHDVYSEPRCHRPDGPVMWFGGQHLHRGILDRLVKYGSGFHPFGTPTSDDLAKLAAGMAAAGRDMHELEMIGGTRAAFTGADDVADVMASMATFPDQLAAGYTTFCMKPSQHTDDLDEVPAICRRMVEYLRRVSG